MYDEPNTTGRPRLPVKATVSRSTSPAGAFGDDGVEPCGWFDDIVSGIKTALPYVQQYAPLIAGAVA